MKGAGSVRYVVLYEMPAIRPICSRSSKARSQMVRRSAGQMARSIDDRGQEKWVPRGFPLSRDWMCAGFQGERYCCLIAVTTKQHCAAIGAPGVTVFVERGQFLHLGFDLHLSENPTWSLSELRMYLRNKLALVDWLGDNVG